MATKKDALLDNKTSFLVWILRVSSVYTSLYEPRRDTGFPMKQHSEYKIKVTLLPIFRHICQSKFDIEFLVIFS